MNALHPLVNVLHPIVLGAALAVASTASVAQFVKGNEAVRTMPDGSRRVETPAMQPQSSAARLKPCAAAAGCHPGPWYMVETTSGLVECTEPFARATACRASTFGASKLSRLWIVKKGQTWLWCQYPDLGSTCVDMQARPPLNLPYPAVQ